MRKASLSSARSANMTKGNMTKSIMTGAAIGAAKNMTGNMSGAGRVMVVGMAMNKTG
jgi:hypothetical protein